MNDNCICLQFYHLLTNVGEQHKGILLLAAIHSAGYFIADTIDIFIDYNNEKRRIYVLHHLVALAGIMTVSWDYYICLYGIWALEIGGVVHHIRHASKVYGTSYIVLIAGEALYHVVYVISRVSLFVSTTIAVRSVGHSAYPIMDMICFLSVYVLIVQNTIWWWHNVKKLVTEPLEGEHHKHV